jgi:hypothetical protein
MHPVIFNLLSLYKKKRADADVERDLQDGHAHHPDAIKEIIREVEAGCRRRNGAGFLGIDCLITLRIKATFAVLPALYIMGKRHGTVPRHNLICRSFQKVDMPEPVIPLQTHRHVADHYIDRV